MDILSNTIVVGILVWSLPKAYEYVTFMEIERTAFLRIPFDLVFSIYIPFVLSLIVRGLLVIWEAVRGIGYEETSTSDLGAGENV